MTFSLEARQIHNLILDNSGTSDYWMRAAGAAIKRGKMAGWFAKPQLRPDFPALTNKSTKSNLVDNFQMPLGATGGNYISALWSSTPLEVHAPTMQKYL